MVGCTNIAASNEYIPDTYPSYERRPYVDMLSALYAWGRETGTFEGKTVPSTYVHTPRPDLAVWDDDVKRLEHGHCRVTASEAQIRWAEGKRLPARQTRKNVQIISAHMGTM
jgi:hypothetical protein